MVKLDSTWHSLEAEEVIQNLKSNPKGLSIEEAKLRLSTFGYNELKKRKRISLLQIFLAQFKNIFVIMLIGAIIISVIIG